MPHEQSILTMSSAPTPDQHEFLVFPCERDGWPHDLHKRKVWLEKGSTVSASLLYIRQQARIDLRISHHFGPVLWQDTTPRSPRR